MRVLLIAPTHVDLPSIDAEAAALSAFHEVERVVGTVRDSDIRQAIEKGKYDLLWWATHGGADGLLLSDSVLSPEAIGQYVSTSGVSLCVLNTCASEEIAFKIIAGGDADMVFTISADVKDEDALRFGSLFAGELAKTDDLEEAFTKAAGPGATKYRYLKAKQALRGMAMQAATAMERLQEEVKTLSQGQYRQGVDLTVLVKDLAILTKRIDQMTEQSLQIQRQATQAQGASIQTADLDRQRSDNRATAPAETPSPFTPTFWVLIVLVSLVVGYLMFVAGRGF